MDREPYVVVIGRNTIDEYYSWNHFPDKGDKVFLDFQQAIPGGYMINCAAVMGSLGAKCYVLDNLGDDKYTKLHMDTMGRQGIDTSYIEVVPGADNSKAIIARVPGESEKTVLLFNRSYPPIELTGKKMDLLKNASIIFTNMRDLRLRPGYEQLVEEMLSGGARLAFDAETTTFTSAESEEFFFRRAAVLSFNEFSYEKYCAGRGDEALRELFAVNPSCIILHTLGSDGCRVLTKDRVFSVPAFPVNPVDTTGAGDTFNGTFLFGLIKGWPLEQCARYACAAGARATLTVGARAGAVPLSDVEAFLRERDAL